MKDKIIELSITQQLDIFERVFLTLIEYPSHRWSLKKIIDARDKLEVSDLKIKLQELEVEILKRKGGE